MTNSIAPARPHPPADPCSHPLQGPRRGNPCRPGMQAKASSAAGTKLFGGSAARRSGLAAAGAPGAGQRHAARRRLLVGTAVAAAAAGTAGAMWCAKDLSATITAAPTKWNQVRGEYTANVTRSGSQLPAGCRLDF